jgi:hypothetical protein
VYFGVGDDVLFVNDIVDNLPTGGVNVVVLQTFDNDGDPLTPFGAGAAANLSAGQITDSAPGFFIYFNSGLDPSGDTSKPASRGHLKTGQL